MGATQDNEAPELSRLGTLYMVLGTQSSKFRIVNDEFRITKIQNSTYMVLWT